MSKPRHATQAHAAPLSLRVRRLHVLALAAAAALLMSASGEGGPQRDSEGALGSATGPGRLDAGAVAEVVAHANPHLGDPQRIGEAVVRYSAHHGLDPELVTAVLIAESDARPWALSYKGAVGLMQVMPYMTDSLELGGNLTTVEANVAAGTAILADNIARLGEDDGISAYFWGSRIRNDTYLVRVREAQSRIRALRAERAL